MLHILNGKLSEQNKMTLTLLNNQINCSPTVATNNVDENCTESIIELNLPATSVIKLLEVDAKIMANKNVTELLVS